MFARWPVIAGCAWISLGALIAPGVPFAAANKAPPLPELRPGAGSPPQPTDADRYVGRAIMGMRGDSLTASGLMALDSAIVLYPADVDARFMRASLTFCGMRRADLASVLADIDTALTHFGPEATALGTTLQSAYGLKTQVELALGRDHEALATLEKAIRLDPDKAEELFNPGTIDPDSATLACNWRKATLNGLVERAGSDYRAYLARGLYYGFFKRFITTSHRKALQDFLTARRLSPSSALCSYFLACEYASGGTTTIARLFNGTDSTSRRAALREFTASIALDPRFAPAYAERAQLRVNQKQYVLAVKDYDALIELEPKNAGALNDRGLTKKTLGNFWGALRDFSEAAKLKTEAAASGADDWTITHTFQSLAECHAALGEFEEAANDMTEAIRANVAPFTVMLSLARLRDLFPECSYMDDDEFLHTLHRALRSTMTYETFENVRKNDFAMESTVVPTAYVQRGDYYLRAGDLRRALADYTRARRAFPNSAEYTDRWRLATENDSQAFYIDSQGGPTPEAGRHQAIWVKEMDKKRHSEGWSIQRISVNCSANTIQFEASTTYPG